MSFSNISLKQRLVIALIIYTLWVMAYAYFSFNQEKGRLYASLDQQLETAALTASLLLPNDLHHQNMVKSDLSSQTDAQNRIILSNFTDNTDIIYIYTLILHNNKIFFTSASATTEERQSGEGLSSYFDHYYDVDPRVFELFNTKQQAFLEYSDRRGSVRSIFMPAYSKDGTFYFAVASILTGTIKQVLNHYIYQALVTALLFLLFIYPLYLVTTQYIRNKARALKHQIRQKSIVLAKNQQRLEQALQSSRQAWFEVNLQTENIIVSDEYSKLLGSNNTKGHISTIQNWQDNIHPEDRDATIQIFQHGVDTGEPITMEFRRKSTDGRWLWIHSSGKVIEHDKRGKSLLMVGINRDVTDRKRNELVLQALAESGRSSNSNIFKIIVRQLALSHDMCYTFIATVNEECTQATTVALWGNGQFIDNISYSLKDTPCEIVTKDKMATCHYQGKIQQLFPKDPLLTDMQAESYIGVPLKNAQNKVLGLIVMIDNKPMIKNKQTITLLNSLAVRASIELERRKNEETLILFSYIFRDSHEGILLVDKNDIIIDINPTLCTNTGYCRDELLGQPAELFRAQVHNYPAKFYEDIKQAVIRNGSWQGEVWNKVKNGDEALAEVTITQITDENNQPTHRFILINDITEKKQQQDALKFMAHYDALTKLPNRTLFVDRFNQAVAHSKRNDRLLAICFLDLDNFKPVNDNYGHDVGDQLLIKVSQRIIENIREEDTVSRQGGDEFTLLLGAIESFQQCEHMLIRILQSIAEPYYIGGHTHNISASIGVTLHPLDDGDIDTLTRHADQAMYQAKQSGKNQYHLFNGLDDKQQSRQLYQQQELYRALEYHQFCLHYQPKVNMKTGKVFGIEALIRWQHPDNGLLFPLDFLPATENTPLENKIGDWVIEQALSQLEKWRLQGIELEVSVNISSNHLQSASFISKLKKSLSKHPEIAPHLLQLEILESSALGDIKTISNLIKTCQDSLGVGIALDDFGTGYSSLTHLRNLPVKTIKIDRTFVRDLLDDPNDFAIINGIIGLADAFHCDVIAEGVETINHGLMLLAMGCHDAQGYGISKPITAQEIPLWLKNYSPHQQWIEFGNKQQSPLDRKIKIIEFTTNEWFQNIKDTVESLGKVKPKSPLTLCHPGTWLGQLRKIQLFEELWLNQLQQAHDTLFTLGEKTMNNYLAGDYEIALDQLEQLQLVFDDLMAILKKEKLL